ncbi:MAG: glycosyltransferase [Planctomycetia bacterium]|nr:glycosyltransferase [Planctomycetia bacterium]
MNDRSDSAPLRVSVCIPTCARSTLLGRAIASVLAQSQLPFEILIGDDSEDDETAEFIRHLQDDAGVPLRLFRNRPALGLGRNIANLFANVRAEAILLLHDDDTVEPKAIETLSQALAQDGVIVAFGRSWIVDGSGQKNTKRTEDLNRYYHRREKYRGLIHDTLTSAVVQQMPDSGFMIRTKAAHKASYAWAARYRNACGFVYNVELAQRAEGAFYFCDEYLHCYHLTEGSLSKSPRGNSAVMAFAYADSLRDKVPNQELYRKWMLERSTVAIGQAAKLGLLSQGWRWFFGPYHRRKIASVSGCKSAVKLLWAFLRGRHHDGQKPVIPSLEAEPRDEAALQNSRKSIDEFVTADSGAHKIL